MMATVFRMLSISLDCVFVGKTIDSKHNDSSTKSSVHLKSWNICAYIDRRLKDKPG